ncbi:MAG TPA: hypothetical protein EYN40_02405 [Planctomycetes bacterium]|nr:hypothetical protein [Planctomycetota bacterium]
MSDSPAPLVGIGMGAPDRFQLLQNQRKWPLAMWMARLDGIVAVRTVLPVTQNCFLEIALITTPIGSPDPDQIAARLEQLPTQIEIEQLPTPATQYRLGIETKEQCHR